MKSSFLSSDGVGIDPRAVDSAAQFIRDYLSREHFEDIDGTLLGRGLIHPLDKRPRRERARRYSFGPSDRVVWPSVASS
jgi:hypothetical protein